MANDYKGRLKYFDDCYLQEITLLNLDKFREYRITKVNVKHTTIKHDFISLRQFLKFCVIKGNINSLPEFPIKSKKDKPNPRTFFSLEEWQLLLKISRERIKNSIGARIKSERELLHDFMVMMVHTGCRI